MMNIDFVSDVACPWCAVGLAGLEQALGELQGELAVEVRCQPFELNPDMGPEGRDIVEYDIAASELEYHLQALGGKFQFQVVANRLKIFVPDNVDTLTAMRWVPSDRVELRRARLKDVYTKLMGHEITGSPL